MTQACIYRGVHIRVAPPPKSAPTPTAHSLCRCGSGQRASRASPPLGSAVKNAAVTGGGRESSLLLHRLCQPAHRRPVVERLLLLPWSPRLTQAAERSCPSTTQVSSGARKPGLHCSPWASLHSLLAIICSLWATAVFTGQAWTPLFSTGNNYILPFTVTKRFLKKSKGAFFWKAADKGYERSPYWCVRAHVFRSEDLRFSLWHCKLKDIRLQMLERNLSTQEPRQPLPAGRKHTKPGGPLVV